jgi:signal transduction histidine kinase
MTQVQLDSETPRLGLESTALVEPAEIVSQIAHELRQPLSTIESIAYYLDLVLQQEQPKIRQQLAKLQQLVDQSNWIVSNAVYFTQAAAPAPEPVDLQEILCECVADSAFNGIRVELCPAETLPRVWLDRAQGLHLVRALIQFFRSASDTDHSIVVTTSATHEEVLMEFAAVARRSSGGEAASDPIETGLPSGVALSLASARRIVDAHHGRIRIVAESALGITALVAFPAA